MSADDTNKIDSTRTLFPFAAVVSQEKAKEALLPAVIPSNLSRLRLLVEGKKTRLIF